MTTLVEKDKGWCLEAQLARQEEAGERVVDLKDELEGEDVEEHVDDRRVVRHEDVQRERVQERRPRVEQAAE